MLNLEYKVVHSIPGRIRLQIRRLDFDANFAIRLQALVNALESVTEVRVDRAAESIVVHYSENSLSEAQLQEQLAIAIKQAANPDLNALMAVKVSDYEFHDLTPYEYLQVQEIIKWRQKNFSVLANLSGKALAPIQTVADALIPKSFLKQVIPLLEIRTDNWHQEWETLKEQTEIDDFCQLKQTPLEQCDRLAKYVKDRAVSLASVEGGAAALLGMAGEIVRLDSIVILALQTIHRTGLCYGYAPETELEQQFAWAILEIVTALTTQERQKALLSLHDLHHVLYQQALENLIIEESVEGKLKDATVEAVLTRVFQNILKLESAEVIPVVGVVMGIVGARATIEEVGVSARREFQLRWLLENQKGESAK